MRFRMFIPAVTVLMAGTVLMTGCNREPAQAAETSGPEAAPAERRTLDIRVEATGLIEPIRVVEVKSKASGEILRLHVETGDEVAAGTLLAEIDPRDVKNALDQAVADLDVAEARLATASAQRERSEELRQANVVTQEEYENAVLAEADGRAALVKAETNRQLAQERMNDVTIRAPLAGTIITDSVEEGMVIQSASSNVSGGTSLMTMANLDEMQVRTLVDETDLGRVSPGLPAQVVVEAYPNRNFRGTVLKIEPQAVVDQNVTMFPVLVRLDNREKLLKPGMNADVQIEVARRDDVVAVPNAAVVSIRDAVAAGDVLGLSEETVQKALGGALATAMEGPENGAQAADQPAETPPQAEVAAAQTTDDCAALRQKLQQGGFAALTDEERPRLRACRPQGAAAFGQAQGGSSDVRPGVVFVKTASGFEPRSVTLGVNDWEFTEVVTGLEAGDSVVLISVAQLQRAQEEFNARMRERMGGFPGAGGRR